MHASQQAHSPPLQPHQEEEQEVSCEFQKIPHLNHNTLRKSSKGKGTTTKEEFSLVRESHVLVSCPFLSFRDSIFLVS